MPERLVADSDAERRGDDGWRAILARWIPALVLGIIAFALVLEITDPVGPGLDPDALQYLGSAESFAAHGEFRAPTTRWWKTDSTSMLAHFPPGYATAIAIPVRFGMEPVQGSRLIGALSAFVTVTTLVVLVSACASALAGMLLAAALFAMSSMHEVHVSVLSEPLFLALTALTVAAMVRRPVRPSLAGFIAALGALTRYVGLALVGGVALWSLMQTGSIAERMRRAVTAVLPAVVLQGLWLVRTRRVAGAQSIRRLALYGDLGPTLRQAAATFEAWLMPDPESWQETLPHRGALTIAAGVLLVLVVIAGVRALRHDARAESAADVDSSARRLEATRLLAAGALVVACYLGLLGLSRLIADPGIPFDERIFSPVFLLLTTIVVVAGARWWTSSTAALPKIALIGAALGWWLSAGWVTRDEARYALQWGSDFAGEQWRRSELLEWARTDGARHPLYTNWSSVLYFYLHRPSRDVPMLVERARLAEFVDTLRARDGRVIEFTAPGIEYVTVDSLRHVPGLRVVAERADGVVLAAVPAVRPVAAPPTRPGAAH